MGWNVVRLGFGWGFGRGFFLSVSEDTDVLQREYKKFFNSRKKEMATFVVKKGTARIT